MLGMMMVDGWWRWYRCLPWICCVLRGLHLFLLPLLLLLFFFLRHMQPWYARSLANGDEIPYPYHASSPFILLSSPEQHHPSPRFILPLVPSKQFPSPHHSSVNRSNKLILKIITSNPIVTTINSANPNHPNIIAAVPTPLFKLPFPKSCAIVLAATEAVCCHSTETSTNTLATKMRARAICETGREGKGLTSRSEPCSSISSCQPGKVARRRKQTKARMMATILLVRQYYDMSAWGG